jgi:predicted transcriptional regulator
VDFWKIAAPAFTAIVAWVLNERSKRKWEKWQIKKDACLKALNLANAVLSNYEYSNLKKGDISPQYESIENARSCFNELAVTCDGPEVINALKKIMFDSLSPDEIVDLRNAVRTELAISNKSVGTDREKPFLAKINCEKGKST